MDDSIGASPPSGASDSGQPGNPWDTRFNDVPKKMPMGEKLLNIFIEPSSVFKNICYHNDWLTPFLVFVLVMSLLSVVQYTFFADQTEEVMKQMIEVMPQGSSPGISKGMSHPAIAILSTTFTTAASWLFITLILFLLAIFFLENSNFSKMLSVVAFAHLPLLFGILTNSIYKLNSSVNIQSWDDFVDFLTPWSISFARALPEGTVIYRFLSNLDLFRLWTFWLLVIGVVFAFRARREKAFWIVGIYFVFFALSKLGGVLYYTIVIPNLMSNAL